MKRALLIIFPLLALVTELLCQDVTISGKFVEDNINLYLSDSTSLKIPVEVLLFQRLNKYEKSIGKDSTLVRKQFSSFRGHLELELQVDLASPDQKKVEIIGDVKNRKAVHVETNRLRDEMYYTFNLLIGKGLLGAKDSVTIALTGKYFSCETCEKFELLDSLIITVYKRNDLIYSLREYADHPNIHFDQVNKITQDGNMITVQGVETNNIPGVRRLYINPGNKYIYNRSLNYPEVKLWRPIKFLPRVPYLDNLEISLTTVPFRVYLNGIERIDSVKSIEGRLDSNYMTSLPAQGRAGLSNLGININLLYGEKQIYSPYRKPFIKRYGLGIFLAPSIVELKRSLINYNEYQLKEELNGAYLSTAVTFTYSINGVSFNAALGKDYGLNQLSRAWIYDREPWFGLGIGVKPETIVSFFQ